MTLGELKKIAEDINKRAKDDDALISIYDQQNDIPYTCIEGVTEYFNAKEEEPVFEILVKESK